MSSVKLRFCDLAVELESTEPAAEQSDRALNMLVFLVQERLKYEECFPCEPEDGGGIPPQPDTNPILPSEVLRAYL